MHLHFLLRMQALCVVPGMFFNCEIHDHTIDISNDDIKSGLIPTGRVVDLQAFTMREAVERYQV